ncbi:hypothetical protein [Flavobacterium sp.]|uniref:hypothetical protein n=1 Tax=Flavobacterium sp. TaxID=239 RepID=UPI00261788B2|nr:hypothetical protein [Flavobacterium sp.]
MEKYQTLQTLCQFGIALFTILAAISGYGAYHFGEKKEMQKQIDSSKGKESNSNTQTTYNIKGDLVQGSKVIEMNKEEINAPSAMIVTNNQSGGTNTINYFQNEYKAINENTKQTIIEKLEALSIKYPKAPNTIIEIESGNTQRHKVAMELEELLAKKDLGVYPKGNTFIGRYPDHPISVFINPINKTFVRELIDLLDLFISGEFKIIEDVQFPIDIIKIYINGQPLFDTKGKVKVQ